MLELRDVSFKYPNSDWIIEKANLEINKGTITGFIGKNGIGKSTLFKLILGINKPTKGKIFFFGQDISIESNRNLFYKLGGIIENPVAYSFLTGFENIEYFSKYYGGIKRGDINEIVNLFGLRRYISQKYSSYSLGTKQKFGLCLAFLHKPDLILLDEPTNGLDPWSVHEIKKIIEGLNVNFGTTFIISSHIIYDLLDISNSILTFKDKKLNLISRGSILSSNIFHLTVGRNQLSNLYALIGDQNYSIINNEKIEFNETDNLNLNQFLKLLIDNNIKIIEVKPIVEF